MGDSFSFYYAIEYNEFTKQYELLPFGALCRFVDKMHTITTSKFCFGKLNLWMQISLIISSSGRRPASLCHGPLSIRVSVR